MTTQPLDKEYIDNRIRSLLANIGMRHPRHVFPKLLFHYTTPHGLLRIMQSNRLWATNVRFMNDSSELAYTYALTHEIISEMRLKVQNENVKYCFDCFADYIQKYNICNEFLDVFACCFCQEGDQLSQWREYSEKGTGFSLGFDVALITDKNIDRYRNFYSLIKVIYDRSTQRKYLEDIITRCMAELISLAKLAPDDQVPDLIFEFCGVLDASVSAIAAQFKDPAFHEEKEWRIVYIRPAIDIIDEIKFRYSNRLIIPYIELDLSAPRGAYSNRLPITTIFQGPQSHPEIGKYSLSLLCKQLNFDNIVISQSSVPLRF